LTDLLNLESWLNSSDRIEKSFRYERSQDESILAVAPRRTDVIDFECGSPIAQLLPLELAALSPVSLIRLRIAEWNLTIAAKAKMPL
jgi:hypothetical protein